MDDRKKGLDKLLWLLAIATAFVISLILNAQTVFDAQNNPIMVSIETVPIQVHDQNNTQNNRITYHKKHSDVLMVPLIFFAGGALSHGHSEAKVKQIKNSCLFTNRL